MWKEVEARSPQGSSRAASAASFRRLSNRKEVMASTHGSFHQVYNLLFTCCCVVIMPICSVLLFCCKSCRYE